MLLLFILFQSVTIIYTKTIYFDEVCDITGRRIYLELSENGLLTSRNETTKNFLCKQCNLEIITCPSCVINYKFNFLNTSENCCNNAKCCDDCVSIYELPFETISSKQFCSCLKSDVGFHSTKTRSFSVSFFYNQATGGSFSLEFSSQRNRQFLVELNAKNNITEQILTSPFFPAYYPSDLSVEYVISCKLTPNCTITLLFTDFLISSSSLIEFFDWNGRRLFLTTGGIFRPPLISSSGPTLVVKFFANGGTNLGFKAEYSFFSNASINNDFVTNCGGHVEANGGVIIFTKTIENIFYNCYWIVKPSHNYFNWKTHLYLTIPIFSNFNNDSTVTIHKGITSVDERLQILKPNNETNQENIVPLASGFYVTFKGSSSQEKSSKLVIVYAAFNYKHCFTDANFLCKNHRCISILLYCDGFDHCGDGSDEPVDCKRSFVKMFPGFLGGFYDFRTAAVVFIVSSLGITCLIFGVIVLLYRISISNQHRRRFQNHLEIINAILEEGSLRGEMEEEEIIIADDPPDYEAPPEYDEVIKNQACCSRNSPPPQYSNRKTNRKLFQWLNLKESFKSVKKERSVGLLVVSYSDGNLERWFSFNRDEDIEESCAIRKCQSVESFLRYE